METVQSETKIILFDGVCNLCNGAVTYIIKRDKHNSFQFAAIQSDIGQKLIAERNIDTSKVDSIILIDPGKAYYLKSTAALEITKAFGGAWPLAQIFSALPEAFRDLVYDLVAKNRYKWFGKQDSCMIPTPELSAKFLG